MDRQGEEGRARVGSGIGRYARDELLAITGPDWDAIAREVGDGAFLVGGEPTFADATVYGLVGNVLTPDVPLPLADQIRAHDNLMARIDRMSERFPIPPTR